MHQQDLFAAITNWHATSWLYRPTSLVKRDQPLMMPWLQGPEGAVLSVDTQPECWQGILHLPGRQSECENRGIELFADTLSMLGQTLNDWRDPIRAIFMGAHSDPFAGPAQAQELAVACAEIIAKQGCVVWIRTRGRIINRLRPRLAALGDKLRITVPFATASTAKARSLEPGAPSPKARMRQVTRLRSLGLAVLPIIEPLIPGVTDGKDDLDALMRLFEEFGISQTTIGYLPLPEGSLDRLGTVLEGGELGSVAEIYRDGPRVKLPGGRVQRLIPRSWRMKHYAHLSAMASRFGIRLHICRWTNPDLEGEQSPETTPQAPKESLSERWKRHKQTTGQ